MADTSPLDDLGGREDIKHVDLTHFLGRQLAGSIVNWLGLTSWAIRVALCRYLNLIGTNASINRCFEAKVGIFSILIRRFL